MRRFSQRNALVTLSEINITPLLDLAFVLLIIFIITTPMLEQGLNLNLPVGGAPDTRTVQKQDIRTVEIDPRGYFMYQRRFMDLRGIIAILAQEARNPRLIVDIRCDEKAPSGYMLSLIDGLKNVGIENVSFRTKPPQR